MNPDNPPHDRIVDSPPTSPEWSADEKRVWSDYTKLLLLHTQLANVRADLVRHLDVNDRKIMDDLAAGKLAADTAELTLQDTIVRFKKTPDFETLTAKVLGSDMPPTPNEREALAIELFQPFQDRFEACQTSLEQEKQQTRDRLGRANKGAVDSNQTALALTIGGERPGADPHLLRVLIRTASGEKHDRLVADFDNNQRQWLQLVPKLALLVGQEAPAVSAYLREPTLAAAEQIFTALAKLAEETPADRRIALLEIDLTAEEAKKILGQLEEITKQINTVCAALNDHLPQLPEPASTISIQPAAAAPKPTTRRPPEAGPARAEQSETCRVVESFRLVGLDLEAVSFTARRSIDDKEMVRTGLGEAEATMILAELNNSSNSELSNKLKNKYLVFPGWCNPGNSGQVRCFYWGGSTWCRGWVSLVYQWNESSLVVRLRT